MLDPPVSLVAFASINACSSAGVGNIRLSNIPLSLRSFHAAIVYASKSAGTNKGLLLASSPLLSNILAPMSAYCAGEGEPRL